MTSCARSSTDGGVVEPSAFAVLRSAISSYRVGSCTGRSAGFAVSAASLPGGSRAEAANSTHSARRALITGSSSTCSGSTRALRIDA